MKHTAGVLAVAIAAAAACAGGWGAYDRYDRRQMEKSLAADDDAGLVLGEFPLVKGGVVDGDTVKVGGLDATLRLLAIDTEETFKSEKKRRAFEAGWGEYLANARDASSRPVKIPTPLGEEAKDWADDFFRNVLRVRLERDHPKEVRGRFNRYLAYVFVERDGKWVNYNIECVRAGMSPYFTKYGYSRRFHDEFVAAQREARAAELGIWDPEKMHYPDYDERLEWWNARGDFIQAFERDADKNPNLITLTHWDALHRLERYLDREVVILGTVGDIKKYDKGPTRVMLSRRLLNDFPVIFWEDEVLEQSGLPRLAGEFVRIRGIVSKYRNKHTKREVLQIEVKLPGQVTLSDPHLPAPGSRKAPAKREPEPVAPEPAADAADEPAALDEGADGDSVPPIDGEPAPAPSEDEAAAPPSGI